MSPPTCARGSRLRCELDAGCPAAPVLIYPLFSVRPPRRPERLFDGSFYPMDRLDDFITKANQVWHSFPLLLLLGTSVFFVACSTSRQTVPRPQAETLPLASDVIASCVVRRDVCILTLENRSDSPKYFRLPARRAFHSDPPFFSQAFLRFPNGEIQECIGANMISEVRDLRTIRLGPRAVETFKVRLFDIWAFHRAGLVFPPGGGSGFNSINDLRTAQAQFKIRISIDRDQSAKGTITCETDWQNF